MEFAIAEKCSNIFRNHRKGGASMAVGDEIILSNGNIINLWNEDTLTLKTWVNKKSTKMWLNVNYLDDWCDGNESLFAKLMILVNHTDIDNIIVNRRGNHYIPISSEKELMDLLMVKKTKWYEIKKFLDKKNILAYCEIKFKNEIYHRYYINPLVTLHSKGLSLNCYKLFREFLLPYLTERTQRTLDEHLTEHYTTEDNITC